MALLDVCAVCGLGATALFLALIAKAEARRGDIELPVWFSAAVALVLLTVFYWARWYLGCLAGRLLFRPVGACPGDVAAGPGDEARPPFTRGWLGPSLR